MAQKVILTDDLDGSDGAETIAFGLDGSSYEIDLSEANAARLRDALAEWVGHARKVSGRSTSRSSSRASGASTSTAAAGVDTSAVRQWAKDNGHQVSERGRISATVMEAYAAAH